MDYPNRRRLKLSAHARMVDAAEDAARTAAIVMTGYPAQIEQLKAKLASFEAQPALPH